MTWVEVIKTVNDACTSFSLAADDPPKEEISILDFYSLRDKTVKIDQLSCDIRNIARKKKALNEKEQEKKLISDICNATDFERIIDQNVSSGITTAILKSKSIGFSVTIVTGGDHPIYTVAIEDKA